LKKVVVLGIALIALFLLIVLSITPLAAADENVEAVPIPEFPTVLIVLLAAMGAAVYLLRKRRISNIFKPTIFKPTICIVLLVLVPFAITSATGFLSTVDLARLVVTTAIISMSTILATLYIRLTGKKKGLDRLQFHLSLANIAGRVLSLNGFVTNLDTRITAAVGSFVGCVYNRFGPALVP